ncbi:hypothetical protein ACH4T9_29625 [Micromonospora sp. NPDC020750]|uniref:hypothetical protein n=1 Tax=unclassified Micromonospora TaxID=2617518 RepID=UPI0037B1C514
MTDAVVVRMIEGRHDRRRRLPGHRPVHPAQEATRRVLTTKQKTYNYSLDRLPAPLRRV